MRWSGLRNGDTFLSTPSGPWGVEIEGNVVLLDARDDEELEHERNDLKKRSGVTYLRLQVNRVEHCVFLGWNYMTNAIRDEGKIKCEMKCEQCCRTMCSGARALEADASLPHPEREAPCGSAAGGEKSFRVMRTASGAVGDEEEALHLYDVDGDMEVYFLEDTGCGWRGTAEKAALLTELVREVTGDGTLRVEEVPNER